MKSQPKKKFQAVIDTFLGFFISLVSALISFSLVWLWSKLNHTHSPLTFPLLYFLFSASFAIIEVALALMFKRIYYVMGITIGAIQIMSITLLFFTCAALILPR